MKIGLPSSAKWLTRRMIRLHPAASDLAKMETSADPFWLPWVFDHESGEYVCHVSACPWLMRLGSFSGFTSTESKRFVSAYIRQVMSAQRWATQPNPDCTYPWEKCFTSEWRDEPFQRAGMDVLYDRLFGDHPSGGVLLGDDVGLGKTVIAIGVVTRAVMEGKLSLSSGLMVSTTNAMKGQWREEFDRFSRLESGRIESIVVDGSRSKRLAALRARAHVHVIHHELARVPSYIDHVEEKMRRKGMLIIDESAVVTNPDTAVFRSLFKLSKMCGRCVLFNATPVDRGITDLAAQTRMVDRDILGSLASAMQRYCEFDMVGRERKVFNVGEFRTRISRVYLRRTAEQCGVQVPSVVAQVRRVEMTKEQVEAYLRSCRESISATGAVALSKMALVQRRALAAEFTAGAASPKLDDLIRIMRREMPREKFVVFSRSRMCVDFAFLRFSQAGLFPLTITGESSPDERSRARRLFSDPESPYRVLVGTEAMDRGLNLQVASVLANLDLPWKPGGLRQRIGRIRRIGQQKKRVLVLNYLAVEPDGRFVTIDEFTHAVLARKKKIVTRVVGKDNVNEMGEVTAASLQALMYATIKAAG